MSAEDLRPLLAPRSIAVIGASEGPRHGAEVMRSLRELGFTGDLFPINPRYQEVYGLPCYPDLKTLGRPVDCVIVAVGRELVPEILRQAGAIGARSAIILSGGFREAGPEGKRLEDEVVQIARDRGIRLLGPNNIGMINMHDRVGAYAAALPKVLRPGPIAAVIQSGSIGGAIGGAGRGLGFSFLVSSGNEADVTSAELIDFFVDDPNTRVIAAFVEGFRQPRRFVEAAARARSAGKPIILLKAGRTDRGRRATASHTGALAGDERVHEAVFRRYGIIAVEELNELLETAELFGGLAGRIPSSGGPGVITASGGEAAVVLDLAAPIGLRFPALAEGTLAALAEALPGFAHPDNPLDVTGVGSVDAKVFRRSLEALVADPNLSVVALFQDMRAGHWVPPLMARTMAEVASTQPKPLVWVSNTTRYFDPSLEKTLADGGIPMLYGTREAVKALAAWLDYGRGSPVAAPPEPMPPRAGALELLERAGDEAGAKRLLESYGLHPAREEACAGVGDALEAAGRIGYPVAVKILSPDIAHKTEAGGVRLGVAGPAELERAVGEVLAAARSSHPLARILGVLIQEMVSPVAEMILGVTRDREFGPVLLAGLGGIFTEVLADVSLRLPPVGEAEALSMLRELRGYPLLAGARGRTAADIPALAGAIASLSRLALELGDRLESLDVNPLAVLPMGQGVRVVDALVVSGTGA